MRCCHSGERTSGPGVTPITGERQGKCPLWHHDMSIFLKRGKVEAGNSIPTSHKLETCFPRRHARWPLRTQHGTFFFEEKEDTWAAARSFAQSHRLCWYGWQRQDRTGRIPSAYKAAKQSWHGRLTARVTLTRGLLCVEREFSNSLSGSSGSCLTVSNTWRLRGRTQPIYRWLMNALGFVHFFPPSCFCSKLVQLCKDALESICLY